jgi:RNA polymerase sigma factor (sigma-70 family)
MHLCLIPDLIWDLLPTYNPNPESRALAWNHWLTNGGAKPVMKFIRWSNGTRADDDEILQETLITAYLKIERGEYEYRDVPFTAFLKKIAWYKIMEASRRYSRQISLDDVAECADEDQSAAEQAEYWREQEALHSALLQLPARRSKVLLLYETGYSTAEIAEQLSIKEELVRKEKSLGMRQLREKMAVAI